MKFVPEAAIPNVQAMLVRGKYSWVWVVRACPYCGKMHEHYGGPLDGDARDYLGSAVLAQCSKVDRQYVIRNHSNAELSYVLDAE